MPRRRIFICYAALHQRAKAFVLEHLAPLEWVHEVEIWHDERIPPGADWRAEIDAALADCIASILIVTPSFLTSPFISDEELPRLFERHAAQGLLLFPIVYTDCGWSSHSLLRVPNPRPRTPKALDLLRAPQRHTAMTQIVREIGEEIAERLAGPPVAKTGVGDTAIVPLTLDGNLDTLPKDQAVAIARQVLRLAGVVDDDAIRRILPGSIKIFVALPKAAVARIRALVAKGLIDPQRLTVGDPIEGEGPHGFELFEFRGALVMSDETLAAWLGTGVSALNQAVKRNRPKFEDDWAFQLGPAEWAILKSQTVTAKGRGGRRSPPWVFTEKGVAMAATLLRSAEAIELSRIIVEVFVEARRDRAKGGHNRAIRGPAGRFNVFDREQ